MAEFVFRMIEVAIEAIFSPRRPAPGQSFDTWWGALPWWRKTWAVVTWIVFVLALIATIWVVVMILWWIAGRIMG